jgi:hypothetical protein
MPSLGIKALNPARPRKTRRNGPPDFLSLPASATFLGCASGSPFKVRYVPSGSLFREPLGTITTMPQKRRGVNQNRHLHKGFYRFLFPLFSFCYK